MSADLLAALVAFAFVTSITPGPNNLMLMASGANFGLARTLPHMLGVALGFAAMVVLVGLGLVGVFAAYPRVHDVLKAVSVAYLLWLAWRIATAAAPAGTGNAKGRPMTFLQAAAFQWVNPKAWAMATGAIAAYAPGQDPGAVALVGLVFALVNLPSVGAWTAAGQALGRWLAAPRRLAAFNATMAALLVASLYPVLFL